MEEFIEDILSETEPTKKVEGSSEDDKTKVDTKPDVEIETNEKDNNEEKDVKVKDNEITIEDLASQIGWNPDYKGDDAVDAATYILKSREIQNTMKDHNIDLKNQLAEVKNSIDTLKEHNERVYRAEIKRMQTALEALKKQKREAVELADIEKVDEIDKQIENLQEDLSKPAVKETTVTNPVFDTWVKDNQWYLTDKEMATYAENVAMQYNGAPLDRLYKIVRQKVREVFPEKFETEKKALNSKNLSQLSNEKEKPIGPNNPVESAKNKTVSTFTKANLTPNQVATMEQFKKLGIMTEEQYIKDIAKMQEEEG